MKKAILIISSIFIFAFLNYSIAKNEQTIASGEPVLLELAPRDPRSLMQGDYMELAYTLERAHKVEDLRKRGAFVIKTDSNHVAQFVRYHGDEPLKAGEKLIRYRRDSHNALIYPRSFMFQEGHAQAYENATYGIFTYTSSGNYLLTGLADAAFQKITPESIP